MSAPRLRTRFGRATAPSLATVLISGAAAIGIIQFANPSHSLLANRSSFAIITDSGDIAAAPSPNAFGRSGQVNVRFTLPGASVRYPLEVSGGPGRLEYAWAPVHGVYTDTITAPPAKHLSDSTFIAPERPGFYRLTLARAGEPRHVVDGITVAVMVPFSEKRGGKLNGYKIGKYLAERVGSDHERPDGFVEITEDELDLPLTKHLRLSDFMTHDGQESWPRYAALDERLLDKLELVFQEVARWHGGDDRMRVEPDVHSGFRTPSHNRRVRRAALDSRHQYGDAADVAFDANNDGRIDATDARLVALAAEIVETNHPDLVGGVGLYLRNGSPYVHIDARGKRARWRG